MASKKTGTPNPATSLVDAWAQGANPSDEASLALAREVAVALGAAFESTEQLVGLARRPCIRHRASGYELVLLPGGTFTMGLTPEDRTVARRELAAACPQLDRLLDSIAQHASPAREITVAPFAIGRRLLRGAEISALTGAPARGDATLSADEATRVATAASLRLPTEAEWELVAREGRGATFLYNAAAVALHDAPEREETVDGVRELGGGAWLEDDWADDYASASATGAPRIASPRSAARARRGSFSAAIMQSPDELVYALTAFRPPADADDGEDVGMRLAVSLSPSWSPRRVEPASPSVAVPPAEAEEKAPTLSPAGAADPALEALLQTIAATTGDRQAEATWAALDAVGYPARGVTCPLPEELSPAQLRVCTALAFEADLPLGNHAIPQEAPRRRRWLGIDPPTALERRVTFEHGGARVSWPLWRVWLELQATGRQAEIPATLSDELERLDAVAQTWVWQPYGLEYVAGVEDLVDALAAKAAGWAEPFLETLASSAPLDDGTSAPRVTKGPHAADRMPSLDPTVVFAGLVPLVRAGRRIEARWERLFPFMEHRFLLELVEALPADRRDDVLVERLASSLTGRGLTASFLVLSRFPLPKLAQATQALLNDKARVGGLPRDKLKALKERWAALLAASPGLVPASHKTTRTRPKA